MPNTCWAVGAEKLCAVVQTDSAARQSHVQQYLQLAGIMALKFCGGSLRCRQSLSYSYISCCNSCSFPVPIAE